MSTIYIHRILPKIQAYAFTAVFLFSVFEGLVAQVTLAGDFEEEAFSGPSRSMAAKTYNDKVEITSTAMNFDAPKQIPPGWTTFKYLNRSTDVHFFVLEKMPEGKTIADTRAEIIPVFAAAMDLINNGQSEEGFAELQKLPQWFFEVVFSGGPGLISPGNIAETTINLEPGTYVIECYVKMPNGKFHSAMGMIEEIQVTGINRANPEPKAGMQIEISNSGIFFDQQPGPGDHTFAVRFKEQNPHENFVGHDVHLVRLEENVNMEELNSWMNWSDPDGFKTPVPKGVQFLGGTQEMPPGKTSYFNASLKPGNYALISEVPNPKEKNMLKTFRVSAAEVFGN